MQVNLEVKDPLLVKVITKMVERSNNGIKKYGATLEAENLNQTEYIIKLQNELMDAVLYMQKLKESSTEEMQEALLKNIEVYEETTL